MIGEIIASVNDALYSYILILVLVLGGIYFTVRTRFVQFRLFKEQIRCVTEKPADGKGVSSFQALMVSTASRVGTGNIVRCFNCIVLRWFRFCFLDVAHCHYRQCICFRGKYSGADLQKERT